MLLMLKKTNSEKSKIIQDLKKYILDNIPNKKQKEILINSITNTLTVNATTIDSIDLTENEYLIFKPIIRTLLFLDGEILANALADQYSLLEMLLSDDILSNDTSQKELMKNESYQKFNKVLINLLRNNKITAIELLIATKSIETKLNRLRDDISNLSHKDQKNIILMLEPDH